MVKGIHASEWDGQAIGDAHDRLNQAGTKKVKLPRDQSTRDKIEKGTHEKQN